MSAGSRRAVHLVRPARHHLPSCLDALDRGWRAEDDVASTSGTTIDDRRALVTDPEGFLAAHDNEGGSGMPMTLGERVIVVPLLPSIRRWIWDGEFCGVVGLRWQPGTESLPPHVTGHIGYAVVPWKRRLGYATEGLRQMLVEARRRRLRWLEIVTSPHNLASQRVVERNGGRVVEAFVTAGEQGAEPALRWRIDLAV